MAELYTYYTVLYQKFSGLWRQYNTNYTINTNHTRGPLPVNEMVSYQSISYSDPALDIRTSPINRTRNKQGYMQSF